MLFFCKVACAEGRCLYSCGPEGEDREADVEDAVSSCPLSNVEGDLVFCEGKDVQPGDGEEEDCSYDNSEELMRKGTWISTIMFLLLGILFTVVCSVFGVMNAFSNPINTLFSVYGLVLWNGIAGTVEHTRYLRQFTWKRQALFRKLA